MKDPRIDALAQILVRYSTKVQPGDVTVIQSTTIAEPLVQAVYEEVLRAGGHPVFQITPEGAQAAFYDSRTTTSSTSSRRRRSGPTPSPTCA